MTDVDLALRDADGDKAARRIQADLASLAGELFDLKSKAQRLRIERMQRRLGELEQGLADREADRDDFIGQWLEEITRPD